MRINTRVLLQVLQVNMDAGRGTGILLLLMSVALLGVCGRDGAETRSSDDIPARRGHKLTSEDVHAAPHHERPRKSVSSDTGGESLLDNILGRVTDVLGDLKRRYPPKQVLFSLASDILDKLSVVKNKLVNKMAQLGFDLTDLSMADLDRLLDKLDILSPTIKNKLLSAQGLDNLTDADIRNIPLDVLPAMSDAMFSSMRSLAADKLLILCERLIDQASSPWYIQAALRGGINCGHMIDQFANQTVGRGQSSVLLAMIRDSQPASSWDKKQLVDILQGLGDAVTVEDINALPTQLISTAIPEMAAVRLPRQSQRRALVARMVSRSGTPTSWNDTLVQNLGRLLEDIDINQLKLIRANALFKAAETLTEVGIQEVAHRTCITNSIATYMTNRGENMLPSNIAKALSWVRSSKAFLRSMLPSHLKTLFLDTNMTSSIRFTPTEVDQIAQLLVSKLKLEPENITSSDLLALRGVVGGFNMDFLDRIPNDTIRTLSNITFNSVPKTRAIIKRFRSMLGERLQMSDVGLLANGLDADDFVNMTYDDIIETLPQIRNLEFSGHLAHKIVTKLGERLLRDSGSTCNDALQRLGKLAQYVPAVAIHTSRIVPVAIGNENCDPWDDNVHLTKAQMYAVVDNIRDKMAANNTFLSANLVKRFRKLVLGLTADDIKRIPANTEILTIVELLSQYEDEMDTSQVSAVTSKIKDYFDIERRNKLDEISEVSILQIGRFLQYLHPEFELLKFLKQFRPAMCREMGRSSLLKISTTKKQALLKFCLKHSVIAGNPGTFTDMTQAMTIDENVFVDLGQLMCGVTEDLADKLTTKVYTVHLPQLQRCPFTPSIGKAIVKNALHLNMNLLGSPEGLTLLGSLLQYADEEQLAKVNKKHLSFVAEHIAASHDTRNRAMSTMEQNGYIRERTKRDKLDDSEFQQQLSKLMVQALELPLSSNNENLECIYKLQVGRGLTDMKGITWDAVTSDACWLGVGTLPSLSPSTARPLLERFFWETQSKKLTKETLASFSPERIQQVPGLIKGLTADEMELVDFSDTAVVATVGAYTRFSKQQLRQGFVRWWRLQGQQDMDWEELARINQFVCGMSAEQIKASKHSIDSKNLDVLGKLRCFDADQLRALAAKVMVDVSVDQWPLFVIEELGTITGGLLPNKLSALTKSQIQAIHPGTITSMPASVTKEFSVDQLGDMTEYQHNAFSFIQRSYMSPDQIEAINIHTTSAGDVSVHPHHSVTVLAVSICILATA